MADPRRRKNDANTSRTASQDDVPAENHDAPPAATKKSFWATIHRIVRQILELVTTTGLLAYGFVGPELKDQIAGFGMGKDFVPDRDVGSLEGKVILVTGGNAGLGLQTIRYLSTHAPSKIYLAARDPAKARTAISSLPTSCPILPLTLDLSSFSSIACAAQTFLRASPRLDILVLNAGIMATPYSLTRDGYETQLGVNHLGHALLTKLLLPALRATPDARVVCLSSMGHHLACSGGIAFDARALEKENTWRRYGSSKLANILYARALARRYPEITFVSLHPGVILTDLFASLRANPLLRGALRVYGLLGRVLPGHYAGAEDGAVNTVWAATVGRGELVSGGFYKPVGVRNGGSGWARDGGLEKRLWEWTQGEMERHGY